MPPRKAVREGIPWDEFRDLTKSHSEVRLRIQRRNSKGQLQTLTSSVNQTPAELMQLEDWLQSFAGGGNYEIEIHDPQNPGSPIIDRFGVHLEGMSRPPRFLGNPEDNAVTNPYGQTAAAAPQASAGGFTAPAPAWVDGVHPTQRGGYVRQSSGRPAPGATVASDQLAMRQFAEHKAETAKTIAKLEATVDKLLTETKRKDEQLAEERERAREERHKSELQRIEQMLKMQMESNNSKPKEEASSAKLVESLAPFAPVLAALVTSRETSASKGLEVQQQGLMALMNATLSQANKPDNTMEMVKTLGPLLLPFLKDILAGNGPKAQAELFNHMAENNLSQVAMMANLIEAFASQGDSEPWWLPMMRETLNGVVGMTEAYMQSRGGLPGQRPAQALPANTTPRQAAAKPVQFAGATYHTEEAGEPAAQTIDAPPNPAKAKARAERATQQVTTGMRPGNGVEDTLTQQERMLLGMLPDAFQSPEWRSIVVALHRENDAEEIAELTASHIVHLINFNMLPKHIEDIVEDPARALDRMLAPLPITSRNPEYVAQVMQHVIELLIEFEAVVSPTPIAEVEEGDEVDEDGEEHPVAEVVDDEDVVAYNTEEEAPAPPAAQAS